MTVVARSFISIPARSATDTWNAIVGLIAPDPRSAPRAELAAVGGIVCCVITQEVLRNDPLVLYGSGPRVRIYCLHGDEAVEADGAIEGPLSFVPTEGDWHMSVPCLEEDLPWVSDALARRSSRVRARACGAAVEGEETPRPSAEPVRINAAAFLRG